MPKSILKEVCILVLLSIAILLIFGIVFYDYIPIGVTIPTKEAYETPDEVKNEINELAADAAKTEVTYEVTDSDLNIYKQRANYKEGKADPFALEEQTSIEGTVTTGTNNSVSNTISNNNLVANNSANNSSNSSNSSNNNFFSGSTSTNISNSNKNQSSASTNNNNSNNTNKNSSSTNNKSDSTGTFFEDKGIK